MIYILNESYLWIIFHSNRLTIGTAQRRTDADRPSGITGFNLRVEFRTRSETGIKPEVSRKWTGSDPFTNFTIHVMVDYTNIGSFQWSWINSIGWQYFQNVILVRNATLRDLERLSYLRLIFIWTNRTAKLCSCRNNKSCDGLLHALINKLNMLKHYIH